jgi:hypothetical protein
MQLRVCVPTARVVFTTHASAARQNRVIVADQADRLTECAQMSDANHWAYVDSLWIGEMFSYDSEPYNWVKLLYIFGHRAVRPA